MGLKAKGDSAAAPARQNGIPVPAAVRGRAVTTADVIRDEILARIEPAVAVQMTAPALTERVEALVAEIADERRLLLNYRDQRTLAAEMVDDMLGLGPLEGLLREEAVDDILVNGAKQVFVERRGKLELSPVTFRNDAHVLHVAQRIGSSIGRRIDESSPMLDARLADGSRVNVIIPPLALRGPTLSIRKFARHFIDFSRLAQLGSASPELSRALEIAARCRLNILISGGTGSGKTTLLNAMSGFIDPTERIITIEDAAELQLRQPHVVQLETRPPNIEGKGAINARELLRNALRMRPDRIIVGEVRGPEAFDMLQAMNTGHNGSMSTIHANSARDAIARVEDMVLTASVNLPLRAIRSQAVSALDVIVQIARMRDGKRRIIEVTEVVGMEGETVTLATLFAFKYLGENSDGSLHGVFEPTGLRPRFLPRLEYYGLAKAFLAALSAKERAA